MEFSVATLGRGTVRTLQDRASGVVLRIGADTFSRFDLALVECFSFTAARRLSAAIGSLKVKSTRDLFRSVRPEDLAVPGIGAFAFAVLGACFELKKCGTLDDWQRRNVAKDERIATFGTIKSRLAKETTKDVRRTRRPNDRTRTNADVDARSSVY